MFVILLYSWFMGNIVQNEIKSEFRPDCHFPPDINMPLIEHVDVLLHKTRKNLTFAKFIRG